MYIYIHPRESTENYVEAKEAADSTMVLVAVVPFVFTWVKQQIKDLSPT